MPLLWAKCNKCKYDTYVCNSGVSNNSRTYITRPDNSSFKVYKNHAPLHCANMEEFWLSWSNDKVQLGSGRQLGQDAFITLNDSVPTSKNYLAVSTGLGASGYWIFHSGKIFLQIDADTCYVKTIDTILENLVKKSSAFSIRSNTSSANGMVFISKVKLTWNTKLLKWTLHLHETRCYWPKCQKLPHHPMQILVKFEIEGTCIRQNLTDTI